MCNPSFYGQGFKKNTNGRGKQVHTCHKCGTPYIGDICPTCDIEGDL